MANIITEIKNIDNNIFTDENLWLSEWDKMVEHKKTLRRCTRCLYDEEIPSISFDEKGVCNYCNIHDELEEQYKTGDIGFARLKEVSKKIKEEGKKKKFDIIVGVSGGADSSYLVILAKELGLRPLAVHFDNTWDSTIAVENISNVLKKLDVELWTYVVDNEEYDDIYRSFLQAGTPDLESPTDIALATTLRRAAQEHGINYFFEGHSFRTEGLFPIGWLYMDAKYISNVQKKFGTMKLKTFPNLWLSSQLKWMIIKRMKMIRPLWYVEYKKDEIKKMLSEEYGWQWYGGHHLENRITTFYHTYFLPRRFKIDTRIVGHAAHVRSNQMDRNEGLKLIFEEAPSSDLDLVNMVKKRLGYTDEEFVKLMMLPHKTFKDYKTYKPTFERFRPFFYLMAKMELIPMSFYIKYTSKNNV